MADLSCSCTNRISSSFATKHFQRESLKIFDLHPPLRRLVSFVAQIIAWKVRCWVTDTQTHTQTHRPSTVTLTAHARRGLIIRLTRNKMPIGGFHAETWAVSWVSSTNLFTLLLDLGIKLIKLQILGLKEADDTFAAWNDNKLRMSVSAQHCSTRTSFAFRPVNSTSCILRAIVNSYHPSPDNPTRPG